MSSQPSTNAGIVTDENSGERHIPESVRPDGSTRKAIKIRPGYRPPEDVEVYKNRTAEAFRERGKSLGIPGAAGIKDEEPEQGSSAANKNAKRREARKKAKAAVDGEGEGEVDGPKQSKQEAQPPKAEEADPEVEREKKARSLKKKLKQAKELQSKKDGGEALLPEQIAKVIKINELVRELAGLGFDAEGEPKAKTDGSSAKGGNNGKD
ncbi:Mago binding protein [Tolypocladium paradoxum]|uniref:Mago binding protein n=1 Tax=Tolypocladium paradoxum TaxID=94208 RepID=A0A2S4LBH1_9HYPO|nr:Mago binding protein [Tolypocladium paradoxum]